MIEKFHLLRNIGQFDSVSPPENTALSPFSFIYAENGRGKTTLSTILRSLARGETALVSDRQRLGAEHPPHIVINIDGDQAVFKDGSWSQTIPDVAIFDDAFVADNVCSGIDLQTSHKQNLHELILGAKGVELSQTHQTHVARIEQHNADLREKGDAIPAKARGSLTVDQFCKLKEDSETEKNLKEAERRLAAAKSSDAIRTQTGFNAIQLPNFDEQVINDVLGQSLSNLEADAANRLKVHFKNLGDGGEAWVSDGMQRIQHSSDSESKEKCPFCEQDLTGSSILNHYRVFFSEAYADLKGRIRSTGIGVRDSHAGDVPSAFERSIRTVSEKEEFWKKFTKTPNISIDTAAISRDWKEAREAVLQQLRAKAAAPLELMSLTQETLDAISIYRTHVETIHHLSSDLQNANEQIEIVKEQASADDLSALTSDLEKLQVTKSRYESNIAPLCEAYLKEKEAKKVTEKKRNETRKKLSDYRENIFPAYEELINQYLQKFNASFRLGQVQSINNRGGSSASYCIVINNEDVHIAADSGPSFRNTLSAGDRNTLALAFFFATLENDPHLKKKIVVIDDPMTSLDEHRSLKTVQEIRSLQSRVSQMIIFSHSKPFLCNLWERADKNIRRAIRISRAANGSEFSEWDVRNDCITEHDKRHELVTRYIQASDPAIERNVAEALRPILEAFMRVAYPTNFEPGMLLGPFIGICEQRHGNDNEILSIIDTNELRALLDYANCFHHDTNSAWETETINDAELLDFADRTLHFASRR